MKNSETTTRNILWNWIVILLTALALLWRYGNIIFPPRLLAEDGIIFTKAAYEHGLTSIFKPYAGYFHVLSKSVAYLAVEVFTINMLPTTFLLAAVCIFLYVAYEYLAIETLSRSARIVAVLSLLLLPGSGQDYLNLTNSHWFTSALYPLLLIAPTLHSRSQTIGRCIFLSPLKDFKIPPRYCADWKACMRELNDNGQVTIRIAPDDSWWLHLDKHPTR